MCLVVFPRGFLPALDLLRQKSDIADRNRSNQNSHIAMQANTKEWIQYGTAVAMITSGIVLAFLSFFLNNHDISEGVLWYISQALIYAGGIFGVSIYFKTRLGEFEHRAKQEIVEYMNYHATKDCAASE